MLSLWPCYDSLQPGLSRCTSLHPFPCLSDGNEDTCLTRVPVKFSLTLLLCRVAPLVGQFCLGHGNTFFECSLVLTCKLPVAAEREDQCDLPYFGNDCKQAPAVPAGGGVPQPTPGQGTAASLVMRETCTGTKL